MCAVVAAMIATSGDEAFVMLAHSRRGFLLIKGINLFAGLATGSAAMALGY